MQFIVKLAPSPGFGSEKKSQTITLNVPESHQILNVSSPSPEDVGRKRQRLDHLSAEEKLFRRKLKNRVAAQTARDRKKARMDELEEIVKQLCAENDKLKRENMRLLAENQQLKSNASGAKATQPETAADIVPFESAELINGPQQKEQGTMSSVSRGWSMLFLLLAMLQAAGTVAFRRDLNSKLNIREIPAPCWVSQKNCHCGLQTMATRGELLEKPP